MEYHRPASLDEASRLLGQGGAAARILAGGTDILVQIREGRRSVDLLIDVKNLPETTELSFEANGGLRLGAATACARIYRDEAVARAFPALIDSASLIGGIQIQSRGSLGGNLCNASPAADSIPTLIVLGVQCRIAGQSGTRTLPVEAMCTGPGQNALTAGELLVGFDVPAPAADSGAGFLRFIPRNEMDIAVVNAAAWVQLDEAGETIRDARLAVGAVAPTPLLIQGVGGALAGQPAAAPNLDAAVDLAREAARPITDMRGSAAQRKHLAGVFARRALERAVARARNGRTA